MTKSSTLIGTLAISFLLTACGSGGGGGKNNVPIVGSPLITPPPAAGQIGDGRLNELLKWARKSQDIPAIAVVVVQQGQVAESGATGFRSISADTPVTKSDRWHLGSLAKAMTATLAGVLVEQAVIDWNTTPLDVWPELAQSMHPSFRTITLKQLLSHTSGLVRPDNLPQSIEDDQPGDTMSKRRAWSAQLLATPPAGPVGRFRYSNGGYVVAGAMLETLTNTPWETLISEQLFMPLGMFDTGFGAPGDPDLIDQPWGHWDQGNRFDPVKPGPGADNPEVLGPAGTVHTTLDDYAKFMLAHIAGARGIPGIVTVPTFQVLHTPLDEGSALGWGVDVDEDWANGSVLVHDGSNVRWYAAVRLAPNRNAGALFVTNAGGGRANAAIDSLADLILERFLASP